MRNLSTWDVSSVADMRRMFSDVKALGGKISKWNVSNATTMDTMFTSDSSLNGDLSGTFQVRLTYILRFDVLCRSSGIYLRS